MMKQQIIKITKKKATCNIHAVFNAMSSFVKKFLNFDKTSIYLLLEKNVKKIIIRKEKGGNMESVYIEKDKLLLIKITEDIDECSAQKIRRKADNEIERYMPKRVVFDFDSVTFMDSAGIGLLIGRYKFTNLLGGRLEIANLTQSVQKIFEMSGILKLIPITNLDERNKYYERTN